MDSLRSSVHILLFSSHHPGFQYYELTDLGSKSALPLLSVLGHPFVHDPEFYHPYRGLLRVVKANRVSLTFGSQICSRIEESGLIGVQKDY
jgi:hypothetical protein